MKKILLFIYKRFPTYFQEFIIADFLEGVPEKMMDQAIEVLAEKRTKVERALYFQAYHIQRRMVADKDKADIFFGYLLQIKVMLALLAGSSASEEHPRLGAGTISMEESKRREKLEENLKGVEDFKNRKSNTKSQ